MVDGIQRFLVVSDIHSNAIALDAVLKDAERNSPFAAKLCAGDVVGYGPNPNEVIERLRDDGFITVLGNHDRAGHGGDNRDFNPEAIDAIGHNAKVLTPENREWLQGLKNTPYIDPEGRFAAVHGSFDGRESGSHRFEDIYVSNERSAASSMESLFFSDDASPTGYRHVVLGVFGHTHDPTHASSWVDYGSYPTDIKMLQFHRHKPNKSTNAGILDLETRTVQIDFEEAPSGYDSWMPKALFNPGSVGQPRHGSYAACYGIFEIDSHGKITLHFKNAEYDVAETQRRMEKAGFPRPLITRLSVGR